MLLQNSQSGLTFTALHPNNTQRQNVHLALKVFAEKNISALTEFGKRFNCDIAGTRDFILSIVQLWKIINVKQTLKGQQLNDVLCEPIRSLHDDKLNWLSMFYVNSEHGCSKSGVACHFNKCA